MLEPDVRAALIGLALAFAAAACGDGGSSRPAPPPPPPPAVGNPGAILCQAECRRQARCTEGGGGPACFRRCDAMAPPPQPAWRADWAGEVAACVDRTQCGRDLEEACVFAVSQRSQAAAACARSARSPKDQPRCAVLNGLLPGADAWSTGCFASGRGVRECTPPFDWK